MGRQWLGQCMRDWAMTSQECAATIGPSYTCSETAGGFQREWEGKQGLAGKCLAGKTKFLQRQGQ